MLAEIARHIVIVTIITENYEKVMTASSATSEPSGAVPPSASHLMRHMSTPDLSYFSAPPADVDPAVAAALDAEAARQVDGIELIADYPVY